MIQGSSHFQKVLTVLAVTYLLHVNAATNNQQVIDDINKLENFAKTLQTPPELLDNILKQMETHCKKTNKTIDKSYLNNVSRCVESHLNMSQLAEDMKAAVPDGKMDAVFRDTCLKWPNIKGCVNEIFNVFSECWESGNKVQVFVNQFVKFFCGDDNSGERIAIFFAEGGLQCIKEHGGEVQACIESKQNFTIADAEDKLNPDELNKLDFDKIPVPKKDEICENMENLHECARIGLKKCSDPTTENLMTSMLRQAQAELQCKPSSAEKVSSGQQAVVAVHSMVAAMAAGVALGALAL